MKNNNYDMPEWNIPVTWEMCGQVKIRAYSLEKAMEIAKTDDSIKLPEGHYVDGSFQLSTGDGFLIRNAYNNAQKDICSKSLKCHSCGTTVETDDCDTDQYWTNNGNRVVFHICPQCGDSIEEIILNYTNDNSDFEGNNNNDDSYYSPSSTADDYSPFRPWNAPGASAKDFI